MLSTSPTVNFCGGVPALIRAHTFESFPQDVSKRRSHEPEIKTKIATKAISGRKTVQHIAADRANHPIQSNSGSGG